MKPLFLLSIAILILISRDSNAQRIDHSLYTSINVFSKTAHLNGYFDNEYNIIDKNNLPIEYRSESLTAFISDSSSKNKFTTQTFFIGYFINNSNDTLLIDRCDFAVLKAETQIFTDNKWVTFQLNLPSDCGLSYFTTKLPPKSFYILQVPDPSDGSIETKFRVRFTYNKNIFYTNDVVVRLTRERIAKTKQEIKPHLWD